MIFLFVRLTTPKNVTLSVEDIGWERRIIINELRMFEEEDWVLPPEAKLVWTSEEIYEYEDVIDHYEWVEVYVYDDDYDDYDDYDYYDDYDEDDYYDYDYDYYDYDYDEDNVSIEYVQEPVYVSVPVYRTLYHYQIDRWVYARSVVTSGSDKNPYWGEVELADYEEEGGSAENYYIMAQNKKNVLTKYSLSYEDWYDVEVGDVIEGTVDMFNNVKIVPKQGDATHNGIHRGNGGK